MDFPHHHHHHHGRRDVDDDRRRAPPPPYAADPYARPPPPAYGRDDPDPYSRPPPPAFGRVDDDPYARPPPPAYGHAGGEGYGRHPPPAYGREDDYGGRAPPPAYGAGGYGGGGSEYGNVQHVGHEVYEDRPHHGGGGAYGGGDAPPAGQQTVRVFCKAGEDYSLAVRHGKVCLARTDRNDEAQHWIKDMKHSTRVKDEEGYPCFSLINKATGEALKHSLGQSHPVRLASYDPNYLDESVLWTESRDVGEGFRCIRMVNNIYLNFDAFHGDKDHGGVRDGTILVLWEWCEGDNQRWKIVPWCW